MSKVNPDDLRTAIQLDISSFEPNYFDSIVEVYTRIYSGSKVNLKFAFEVDINDFDFIRKTEKFQQDVLKKSAQIELKNGSIKYVCKTGEVTFTLGNNIIILTNKNAPECLREALSEMFCFDNDTSEE